MSPSCGKWQPERSGPRRSTPGRRLRPSLPKAGHRPTRSGICHERVEHQSPTSAPFICCEKNFPSQRTYANNLPRPEVEFRGNAGPRGRLDRLSGCPGYGHRLDPTPSDHFHASGVNQARSMSVSPNGTASTSPVNGYALGVRHTTESDYRIRTRNPATA